MSSPGFFYSPEDQANLQAIQRRQAFAQALMEQGEGNPGSAAYGGLRNAGNAILGAFLAKKADKQNVDLATAAQAKYAQDLGRFLTGNAGGQPTGPTPTPSPQISQAAAQGPQQPGPQQLDPEGNPLVSQQPQQQAPQSFAQRLARTNNPYLMQQFAPEVIKNQMALENKHLTMMSPQDVQALGLRGVWARDAAGNPVQVQASDVKSQAAIDQEIETKRREGALPLTTAEQSTRDLGYAQLNKPVALGFGQSLVSPRTGKVVASGPSPFGEPTVVDPNSNSLNAQTGLSQPAIEYLQSGKLPRTGAMAAAVQREVQEWSVKNGINTATLKAQASATNNTLQQNLTRNNQATILEHELSGTIQSVAPIADAIGQGRIKIADLINVWAGRQVNDPNVMIYRDQLLRLRSELAGYNAVAAGKLTDHGTPRTDDGDLHEAEQIINNGLNSGGLQGLLQSIGMTTTKNRNILQNSVDDANQQMWGLFGVGKNYKRTAPPLNLGNGPAPQPHQPGGNKGGVIRYDKNGNRVP